MERKQKQFCPKLLVSFLNLLYLCFSTGKWANHSSHPGGGGETGGIEGDSAPHREVLDK